MKSTPLARPIVIAGIAFLIMSSTACVGILAQSRDETDAEKRFVGTWRLASWEQRLANGTTERNRVSSGYIIYTDANRMCYVAMDPDRPTWNLGGKPSAQGYQPTPEEAISGMNGLGAYCAVVEVHAKEGFVLHHVEIERVPNLVGITRKRWFTFEGADRLVLRTDAAENHPTIVESIVTWERVRQ